MASTKKDKMSRKIFLNGCLDCFHPGHYTALVQARMNAGRYGKVILALDSDEKIKKDKGDNRPYFSFEERKQTISKLKYPIDSISYNLVDEIYEFNSNEELYQLIKDKKPDIIMKGEEWKGNVVGQDIAEVIFINKEINVSTTNIESRILSKNEK